MLKIQVEREIERERERERVKNIMCISVEIRDIDIGQWLSNWLCTVQIIIKKRKHNLVKYIFILVGFYAFLRFKGGIKMLNQIRYMEIKIGYS